VQELDQPSNRYWAPVDPDAPNNAHAFSLELVGHNKRVLELGPAAGAVTRALADRGCRVVGIEVDPEAARHLEGVAEAVVVGDLADPEVVAAVADDEGFDVVLAGDVLEHLPDPLAVLRACRRALRPGGYVVVSLPNIAHADVKLRLLAGQFDYRETGLLDRTHLTFFTRASLGQLLEDAGFLLVDLRRVLVPVFTTEQAVEAESVEPAVLQAVMADPESETYQFVARAMVHDGDAELARLAERIVAAETELERERARCAALEVRVESGEDRLATTRIELEEARAEIGRLQTLLLEAEAHARGFEALSEQRQANIDAIRSTRSYRLLAPFRAVFARRS